jgi:hypothetical protein
MTCRYVVQRGVAFLSVLLRNRRKGAVSPESACHENVFAVLCGLWTEAAVSQKLWTCARTLLRCAICGTSLVNGFHRRSGARDLNRSVGCLRTAVKHVAFLPAAVVEAYRSRGIF